MLTIIYEYVIINISQNNYNNKIRDFFLAFHKLRDQQKEGKKNISSFSEVNLSSSSSPPRHSSFHQFLLPKKTCTRKEAKK
jgi:hypothetical protein